MQEERSKYFARPPTGFDENAVKTWIYPTNFPIREYQLNICRKCLFTNTLVILPTGLGKTLIAAVVMMNFYRWYPRGKVIFLAPSKPLVAQQIEACVTIVAIPQNDSIQMTGAINPEERKRYWKEKRVYFLTPQVFVNDMITKACDPADVKCLIVDEAHRAMGNHAYTQVVKELAEHNDQFRVLALTATPGKDRDTVQKIIDNLLIAHIEMRCDQSLDIQQYTHERNVEKIVVPLCAELQTVKNCFLPVLRSVIERLQSTKVFTCHSLDALTKFSIMQKQDVFREKHRGNSNAHFKCIDCDFTTCISLCHAKELLQHGVRPFHSYMLEILKGNKGSAGARAELSKHAGLMELLGKLTEKFNSILPVDQGKAIHFAQIQQSQMPGPSDKIPPNVIGNPKLSKLLEIVEEHFKKIELNGGKSSQTRVMIFSQYRDSVHEITCALNCCQPLIRATSFVGQQQGGSSIKGQNQKEQMQVVKDFEGGYYNTLVATCIGEEGLDIGEVDLIVCYDLITNATRAVQRMGRTGRKRDGKVVYLLTAGREEEVFKKTMNLQRNVSKTFSKWVSKCRFYERSHRMVPDDIEPICEQRYMAPVTFETKSLTKKPSVRNYSKKDESPFLDENQAKAWKKQLRVKNGNLKCLSRPVMLSLGETPQRPDPDCFNLSEWLSWQTTEQTTFEVEHSAATKTLVHVMGSIEMQEGLEDSDSYGADLARFLRLDDVLQRGEVESVNLNKNSLFNYFKHETVPADVAKPSVVTKPPAVSVVDLSEDEDFAHYPKRNSSFRQQDQLQDENVPNELRDNNLEVCDTVGDDVKSCDMSDSSEKTSNSISALEELFILGSKAFKDVCEWKGFSSRDSNGECSECDEIADSDEEEFFSEFDPKKSSFGTTKHTSQLNSQIGGLRSSMRESTSGPAAAKTTIPGSSIGENFAALNLSPKSGKHVGLRKTQTDSMDPPPSKLSKMENDSISQECADDDNFQDDLLLASPDIIYSDEDDEELWMTQPANSTNHTKAASLDGNHGNHFASNHGSPSRMEYVRESTPKPNKTSGLDADFFKDDWEDNEQVDEMLLAKYVDDVEAQLLGKSSVKSPIKVVAESPIVGIPKIIHGVAKRKRLPCSNKEMKRNECDQNLVMHSTAQFIAPRGNLNCNKQELGKPIFDLGITLSDVDSGSSSISASPSPPRKKFILSTLMGNQFLPNQGVQNVSMKVEDMELVFDDEIIDSDEDFKPIVKNYAIPAASISQPSTSYCVRTVQHAKKRSPIKGMCSSKSLAAQFIDMEAIDSSCDSLDESLESRDSKMDVYEKSFLDERNEFTQVPNEDMTAVYLKSIRSPLRPKGLQFVAAKSPVTLTNIYSQVDREMDDDDYVPDSFCVGSDEIGSDEELKTRKFQRIWVHSSSEDEISGPAIVVNNLEVGRADVPRSRTENGSGWITRPSATKKSVH